MFAYAIKFTIWGFYLKNKGNKIIRRKNFKMYSKFNRKRNKKIMLFKFSGLFLIISLISYVTCLFIQSYKNRQHVKRVEIPENYGEEQKENVDDFKNNKVQNILDVKGVELPKNIIFKEKQFKNFLKKAKEDGKNAVIVNLKDEMGNVLYDSEVKEANLWKTAVKNAVDVKEIVKLIKEEGLKPIAKINVFKDSKAPNPARDNTFVYEDYEETMCKFEDFKTKRKQVYLNPFKKAARSYIFKIVEELISSGFSYIYLENFNFPSCEDFSIVKDFDEEKKHVYLKAIVEKLNKICNNKLILGYDYSFLKDYYEDEDPSTLKEFFGFNVLSSPVNLHSVIIHDVEELNSFKKLGLKLQKEKKINFIPKLELNKKSAYYLKEIEEDFNSNIVLY